MISVDFEGETLWHSDPENLLRPGTVSMGAYGPKVGVLRLLDVLEHYAIQGTFFTPGWIIEKYPDRIARILDGGHELAGRTYSNVWLDPRSPSKEEEDLDHGIEVYEGITGEMPRGFRWPKCEPSENAIRLLTQRQLLYESSLQDDVVPYRHMCADGSQGLIQLPTFWNTEDAVYGLYNPRIGSSLETNSHILEMWQAEFSGYYEFGDLFNLSLHPECIGRPGRLSLLRKFLEWLGEFSDTWIGKGTEIAEAWALSENTSGPTYYSNEERHPG
jgi:peptidoglycan/xylan/chitin deacetylase (PgdA/CDA1 family)